MNDAGKDDQGAASRARDVGLTDSARRTRIALLCGACFCALMAIFYGNHLADVAAKEHRRLRAREQMPPLPRGLQDRPHARRRRTEPRLASDLRATFARPKWWGFAALFTVLALTCSTHPERAFWLLVIVTTAVCAWETLAVPRDFGAARPLWFPGLLLLAGGGLRISRAR